MAIPIEPCGGGPIVRPRVTCEPQRRRMVRSPGRTPAKENVESQSNFGTGRVVVLTLALSAVAFALAMGLRPDEVEPRSEPLPQATTPTVEPRTESAFAEQVAPQIEEIPPPELPDPGEGIEEGAIESLLDEAQRSALASSLRIEGLGDAPPNQTQTAEAAAAFVAAVDHQWWAYRRFWSKKPERVPSFELLFAALRESPRGLESGSLSVRATPRPASSPSRGNGTAFTLHTRIPVTVEVGFGYGAWDFVVEIQKAAVSPEIWDAYRAPRPEK